MRGLPENGISSKMTPGEMRYRKEIDRVLGIIKQCELTTDNLPPAPRGDSAHGIPYPRSLGSLGVASEGGWDTEAEGTNWLHPQVKPMLSGQPLVHQPGMSAASNATSCTWPAMQATPSNAKKSARVSHKDEAKSS